MNKNTKRIIGGAVVTVIAGISILGYMLLKTPKLEIVVKEIDLVFEYGDKIDLTNLVEVNKDAEISFSEVDKDTSGTYKVNVTATSGKESVTSEITYKIEDTSLPTLQLNEELERVIPFSSEFKPADYISEANDSVDGKITETEVIDASLLSERLEELENAKSQLNESIYDYTNEAADSVDENVVKSNYVLISSSVDTQVPGEYVVTYVVVDKNYNITTQELKVQVQEEVKTTTDAPNNTTQPKTNQGSQSGGQTTQPAPTTPNAPATNPPTQPPVDACSDYLGNDGHGWWANKSEANHWAINQINDKNSPWYDYGYMIGESNKGCGYYIGFY